MLDWELAQFDSAVDDVFGFRAVQIGLPEVDFLRQNRISHRFSLALEPGASLAADPVSGDLYLAFPNSEFVTFAAAAHDVLRIDPATGKVTDTLEVPIPRAVATAQDGSVYVFDQRAEGTVERS